MVLPGRVPIGAFRSDYRALGYSGARGALAPKIVSLRHGVSPGSRSDDCRESFFTRVSFIRSESTYRRPPIAVTPRGPSKARPRVGLICHEPTSGHAKELACQCVCATWRAELVNRVLRLTDATRGSYLRVLTTTAARGRDRCRLGHDPVRNRSQRPNHDRITHRNGVESETAAVPG